MGTSKSFAELAGKMDLVADNIIAARTASFRQAERDMQPIFNRQARAAAGGDRRLSNHGSVLSAFFRINSGATSSTLQIRPQGAWGIRDNTDIGGRTASHAIYPKNAKRLVFTSRRTGKLVYAQKVNHPGSTRGPFWGGAREDSLDVVRKRIPEDVRDAIVAALNGSGFKSRR